MHIIYTCICIENIYTVNRFLRSEAVIIMWFNDFTECHKMAAPHCDHMGLQMFSIFCFPPTVQHQPSRDRAGLEEENTITQIENGEKKKSFVLKIKA